LQSELDALKPQLDALKQQEDKLSYEVQHYKSVLSDTVRISAFLSHTIQNDLLLFG